MDDGGAVTLRARYVFPIVGQPIEGGTITLRGDRIIAVGRSKNEPVTRDLGNAAILPGLVNAHTHLEFSDLRSPLGQAGASLPDWIRQVLLTRETAARSAVTSISRGLSESIAAGATMLGEIATGPLASEFYCRADVTVFRELIAMSAQRAPQQLAVAERHLVGPWPHEALRPGLSPHAPYTVSPRLLDSAITLARAWNVPAAMHLAESREELELLAAGTGPLVELLKERGVWTPGTVARGTRPLDYLRALAQAPRSLVIHGNYLAPDEIDFLGQHRQQMSVVFCPRTHARFGHDPYPLGRLLAAGAQVALGTDSRASNPDLSLLNEMRFVVERYRVGPQVVLELATRNGAAALGRLQDAGMLEAGKLANLAVVALPDRRCKDPHELLLEQDAHVIQTWWRGRRVYDALAE